MISAQDTVYLQRCIELAEQALDEGNPPFGSILVDASGEILVEDYNQVNGGDRTHHPEFSIARWASTHMTPCARHKATVYTSGEHCPMCAAAHGWVGLGRIVYATSSQQLADWLQTWGIRPSNVNNLAITDVITDVPVDGPAPELVDAVYRLHAQFFGHKHAH